MTPSERTNVLIIYHQTCADGMTAAWIASKQFSFCELVPAQYGDDPPDVTDRDVLVLDFSYPRAVMEEMHRQAITLRVLDHHKTAAADCVGLDFCTFDMEQSGAQLTWDYIHEHTKPPPKMVQYIEDADLWRFELELSRAVRAYVQSFPYTLEAWDDLMSTPISEARGIGAHILRFKTQQIKTFVLAHAYMTKGGMVVLQTPVFISDACHMALAQFPEADIACAFFRNADGQWVHSLRSRSRSDVDVSEVAKLKGGGGHKHAAGFTADTPQV